MLYITFDVTLGDDINPFKCINEEFNYGAIRVPKDICIGNKDAKVTIIDYSSFKCYHCSEFYSKVLLLIDDKYIKSGKVLLIIRDFPVDSVTLDASVLLRCCYDNLLMSNEQYLSSICKIFDIFRDFSKKEDIQSNLYKFMNNIGLSEENTIECLGDERIKNEVLSAKLFALRSPKINISSTPTIFINGNKYVGAIELDNLEKVIDGFLNVDR